MRFRRVYLAGICALSLGLAACDSGIAFPGFDTKPETENTVPPPPGAGTPPPPTLPVTETTPETAPTLPAEPTPAQPDPVDTSLPEGETPPITEVPETPALEDPVTDPVDETLLPTETSGTIDTPSPETPATETPTETPADPPAQEVPPPSPAEPEPEPATPIAPAFSYHAPGNLTPGSGQGSPDETVYAPDMVFPIQSARTFPQSMVFSPGGFRYDGNLPGDECIPENYEYPWRDNFCERGRSSSFKSVSCPAGSGIHLGQDIRVGDGATCQSMRTRYRTNTQSITDYKVVAAEDGVISNISSYTVTLRSGPRTYRYLHLNMRALQVSIGDTVSAGQHIGYVSKDFGFDSAGNRRPTTFHLHFELRINTEEGSPFVPPYTSLVEAYARRENAPGELIERNIAIASDTLDYDPNEVFEFSE